MGLRQARQGLVQAQLGRSLVLGNAGERFTGAVGTVRNSRVADGYRTGALADATTSVRGTSERTALELEQALARRQARGEPTSPTVEAALGSLQSARAELDVAEASGDILRIQAAALRLGDTEMVARATREAVSVDVRTFASLRPPQSTNTQTVAGPASYRIRAGDNPTVIAARITAERAAKGLPGISAQDILEANGLNEGSARRLQPGQELVIPNETRHANLVITPAQLEQQRRGAVSTRGGTYAVAAGMTLGDILRANPHVTEAEVRALNPQIGADGRVYAGQTLEIPPADRIGTNAQGERVAVSQEVLEQERARRASANRIALAVKSGGGLRAGP